MAFLMVSLPTILCAPAAILSAPPRYHWQAIRSDCRTGLPILSASHLIQCTALFGSRLASRLLLDIPNSDCRDGCILAWILSYWQDWWQTESFIMSFCSEAGYWSPRKTAFICAHHQHPIGTQRRHHNSGLPCSFSADAFASHPHLIADQFSSVVAEAASWWCWLHALGLRQWHFALDFNVIWNAANPPPVNWQGNAAFPNAGALPPLGL